MLVLLRDTADLHAAGAMLRTIRSDLMVSSGESVHLFPLRWADADRHGGLIRNVVREGKRL